MYFKDVLELIVLFFLVLICAKPLGVFIAQVMDPKEKTVFDFFIKPIEKSIYRLAQINPLIEQDWKHYLVSIIGFTIISFLATTTLLALQYYLPLNPEHFSAPSWDLNINTAVSFVSNTDWQSYKGESTLSYCSQMTALTVQNFLSAAVGLCAAGALVRGIVRKNAQTIGNFWTDLVRITLYLLLPFSIVAATFFLSEGVPQNFSPYVQLETIEGKIQTIAQGPIASQEAIKLLGTNGGGFMNVNSAHPYENPTPLTNFFQMFLILLIPVAQIYYFGLSAKDTKHAWCVIAALSLVFLVGVYVCADAELKGSPTLTSLELTKGNWEGKEQRFGIVSSALYACITTAASCGAVNAMHDSFTPIGGLIPMLNMELSEVIFGGVGAGLYSVLLFVFLSIFLSGLIIGRTPEYFGKKIESYDVKMTVLAILPYVFIVHACTALACSSSWGVEALGNSGPHGFSEILYAYSSAAANNGSAFAGLSANQPLYNLTLAAAMLFGRFLVMAPVIAIAGSFAAKKIHPITAASFPISSPVFISLLVGVILLVGALTFLPALTMGPIIEQFSMIRGILFS